MATEITNMAVFCDFENVALGVRDANYSKFDIDKVLERLLLKGNIVVRKAYCDWDRYKQFKRSMHEASFELIEIPHVRQSGKNSADIRLVVDALDLCYTKSHVDTFVIISGDSESESRFTSRIETATQAALASATSAPSCRLLSPGRTMTSTPMKPTTVAVQRRQRTFSLAMTAATRTEKSGWEKAMAVASASGSIEMA